MNWEVPAMKSGISLFDPGISKNLLKRCWPLWVGYFTVLVFVLPVAVYELKYAAVSKPGSLNAQVLSGAAPMVYVSFAAGLLAALAMFGHLYSVRSCGMMAALPVCRETVFVTAYLTGLVPLLAADLLVALVTAAFSAGSGAPGLKYLLIWLAAAAMTNVLFYSFAVFCAMLTGSAMILPLAYAALSLTAWAAEGCVRYLLSIFVYGMSVQVHFFDFLSPVVDLGAKLSVALDAQTGVYSLRGLGVLGVYCAAALLLACVSLLLYRRRQMETATDTVAIPALRPVFKYCMTFGCAVVFAWLSCDLFFSGVFEGFAAAVFVLALMFVGAFIGYFTAEMLIQKTVRVFGGGWRGFVVACCALTALTMCVELDVFGYEKRVPSPESVESARLLFDDERYTQEESIEQITALHEQIIRDKARNEQAEEKYSLTVGYRLKNGREILRVYDVDYGEQARSDPDSDIRVCQRLKNLPEAVARRAETDIPVTARSVTDFYINCYFIGADDSYKNDYTALSAEQAEEFYRDCLLPDIADGAMGRLWMVYNDEYYDTVSNVSVTIGVTDRDYAAAGNAGGAPRDYLSFTVTMDAERCIKWIRENTDFDIEPLRVADPPRDADAVFDYGQTYTY